MKVRVRLVFEDWQQGGMSVYHREEGVRLSMGDLHSGSTFRAEIELGPDAAEDLVEALQDGYTPVFYVILEER